MQTDTETLPAPLVERFAAIVGARHALRDAAAVAPYGRELRGLFPGRPGLVLRPADTDEVSRILALASETGTPVVPQGGNTGLVGGQMPDASGREVVLSLARLDRIREIDADSATMTVEAGAVLQAVQEAAAARDLLYPLSLGSQGSCQIGGTLSSNAGGIAVLAYGNARELCLGLEVVLPTGEVLDDLRKLKKDNTGYDLKNLFIGAEGTLGVITAAVLKLVPMPRGRDIAWAGLASPDRALALFRLASARAGAALTAFELVGRTPMDFTLRHMPGAAAPLSGAHDWYVMLELSSGRSADESRAMAEQVLAEALEKGLVDDAVVSRSETQVAAFRALRETMSEAQRPEGASIKHDISVPVVAIPGFIDRAAALVEAIVPGSRVVCFGHMGDGNLHYNVSQPAGGDAAAFMARYGEVNAAVHDLVRALGGSFSAEHGIGRLKRDELAATAPPLALDLMRRIKHAFDPAGIMNPGKVI
ncbi:FAD-binding oxidoreductase [Aquibium sp. A9E412]|uniref:FAD-binding oxidoreductase n=1 Tax=Aquibium sp. A9E412 TaxID=2976767 RepID=UPI0025B15D64|nr:FAD-binding oxidoreductase [Aquibium sp. A9E412]MDN2566758.1 FAD-binding oxidoreductase [Aquibium sp. A9E412]